VDPARVYATGMSNGAMMAHRLGIELPDRIAAIAPVVGALFGDERLPRLPVPALIINGALDRSVPVEGGPLEGRGPRGTADAPLKPAAYQGEFWSRANRCTGVPIEEQAGPAVRRWRHPCPSGQDVVRLLVLDGGHAWPGGRAGSRRGDRPSASIDATDVIWDFFRTKARVAR
jgi:polyhydroxybutyrate depolymerase